MIDDILFDDLDEEKRNEFYNHIGKKLKKDKNQENEEIYEKDEFKKDNEEKYSDERYFIQDFLKNDDEYLNDEKVTEILLRDIKNKKISNELGAIFLLIQKNVFKKHNFSGYYGHTKELMIESGIELFLTNWFKFQWYRVKNNFKKYKETEVAKNSEKKSKIIYLKNNDLNLEEFDLIEIQGRTYNVDNFKIENENIKINIKNKLKNDIKSGDKAIIYKKKEKITKGGFSFLTMFVFTGAKMALNKIKKIKENEERFEFNSIGDLNLFLKSNVYKT